MATRVRWLGHAALLIESDGKRILIDPFLTGNPAAAIKADEAQADAILVSCSSLSPCAAAAVELGRWTV